METLVHVRDVAAGQVGAATSLKKESVARDEAITGQETLATWGVPRSVQERDVEVADRDDISTRVDHKILVTEPGCAHDPWGFFGLDVYRNRALREKRANTLDGVTHHRTTDMVRVIVGREDTRQCHVILGDDAQDVADCVGRVHHDTFACVTIADEINEVDHLVG